MLLGFNSNFSWILKPTKLSVLCRDLANKGQLYLVTVCLIILFLILNWVLHVCILISNHLGTFLVLRCFPVINLVLVFLLSNIYKGYIVWVVMVLESHIPHSLLKGVWNLSCLPVFEFFNQRPIFTKTGAHILRSCQTQHITMKKLTMF